MGCNINLSNIAALNWHQYKILDITSRHQTRALYRGLDAPPPVNDVGGPGGEGWLAGGEVGHQGCDLLRGSQPSHGLPLYELLLGRDRVLALIDSPVPGGSLHGAGTDGVASDLNSKAGHKEGGEVSPHPSPHQVCCQAFSQSDHSSFRGPVGKPGIVVKENYWWRRSLRNLYNCKGHLFIHLGL